MKKKNNKKKYRGISFIEGIIAVFILTAGMIPVIGLISSSIRGSIGSKDQTTAVLLSQEGVELVRNIRDNNWASGEETFDSGNFPNNDAENCRIEYNIQYILGFKYVQPLDISCSSGSTSKRLGFKLLFGNETFAHVFLGAESIFQRKIIINYLDANGNSGPNRSSAAMARIQSIVVWQRGNNSFPSVANCNTANKCTYTEIILSKWGEE